MIIIEHSLWQIFSISRKIPIMQDSKIKLRKLSVCMHVHCEYIDHLLPEHCILKYPLSINLIRRSVVSFSFLFIPRKYAELVGESTKNNLYRNNLLSHRRLQHSLSEALNQFLMMNDREIIAENTGSFLQQAE